MEIDAQRLRELRQQRVLSMRELEERSGVSYHTIWRLENGKSGAHPRTLRRLAEALGVDSQELVMREK
jgi:transcriptional regulator with XRE-family HTH domain